MILTPLTRGMKNKIVYSKSAVSHLIITSAACGNKLNTRTKSRHSSKEELNVFIDSVNSVHPALNRSWEISENSLAFLNINICINDNVLSTSVHYKPTDSHNYLLHSSSLPQHVKNAIPFSQFLRLRRLCSDDTDFNIKCEEMCQSFKKTRLP